jgi:hypothetical protein
LEWLTEAEGLPLGQESKEQLRVELRQESPISYCGLILLFTLSPFRSLRGSFQPARAPLSAQLIMK